MAVRAATDALRDLLYGALDSHAVDVSEDSLPQGLGIRAADEHSPFHWLYWGRCPLVRTRDAERLVRALERYLAPAPATPTPELQVRLTAGVLTTGQAFLLPALGADLARLDRRLQSAGAALVDGPHVTVDPVTGELVLREPEVALRRGPRQVLVDQLGTSRQDPRVAPGRYPIARWLVDGRTEDATGAVDVARLLSELVSPTTEGGLQASGTWVQRLRIVGIAVQDVGAVVTAVVSGSDATSPDPNGDG